MSDIKEGNLIKEQPIEKENKKSFQIKKYICKIYLKNGEIGIGFFCKIPFNNNLLPVLILNTNGIDNNTKILKLIIDNEEKKIEINNSRKKYISPYKNINIAIIEIKPNEDEIYNYLELDNINKKNENLKLEYKNKSIDILYYPNEKPYEPLILINDLINNDCRTEDSSSSCLKPPLKTIEIHYDNSQNIKINYDTFIKNEIDEFNKSTNSNNNKYKDEFNIIYETNKGE